MRFSIASLMVLTLGLPLAAQTPRELHICVRNQDGTMRVEKKEARCPAGELDYRLALGAEGGGAADEKKSNTEFANLSKTVDQLRTRVADLEHELAKESDAKDQLSRKVIAPFVVVDHSGKVILRVRDDLHGLEMVNPSGQTVLWASALDKGGVIKTRSSGTFPEVVMGSSGSIGGFVIRDAEDQARASLSLSGGKPSLELSNDNHTGIVSINQSPTGGGFLQLGAATGNSVVQAGVTSGGSCGRVDAYPLTPSGRTLVGAPPSFIMGKC